MLTTSARTANEVSVIVAFWPHACMGSTIRRTCFSEVITAKCDSRKSMAEVVGDILEIILLLLDTLPVAPAWLPLPVRLTFNERLPSPVLEIEPSVARDLSFQACGFSPKICPLGSRKLMFRIAPFKRKIVAAFENKNKSYKLLKINKISTKLTAWRSKHSLQTKFAVVHVVRHGDRNDHHWATAGAYPQSRRGDSV